MLKYSYKKESIHIKTSPSNNLDYGKEKINDN